MERTNGLTVFRFDYQICDVSAVSVEFKLQTSCGYYIALFSHTVADGLSLMVGAMAIENTWVGEESRSAIKQC